MSRSSSQHLKNLVLFFGLKANLLKSKIYFGGLTPTKQSKITAELLFDIGVLLFHYLGVPVASKKLEVRDFTPLVSKFTRRIQSWVARTLSYLGCLQLITSVLFSIQAYWSTIFLFPSSVSVKINAILCSFRLYGEFDSRSSNCLGYDVEVWDSKSCCHGILRVLGGPYMNRLKNHMNVWTFSIISSKLRAFDLAQLSKSRGIWGKLNTTRCTLTTWMVGHKKLLTRSSLCLWGFLLHPYVFFVRALLRQRIIFGFIAPSLKRYLDASSNGSASPTTSIAWKIG
ncbi:hypothetical protein V2J09_020847 [Rumex salicifolius]